MTRFAAEKMFETVLASFISLVVSDREVDDQERQKAPAPKLVSVEMRSHTEK